MSYQASIIYECGAFNYCALFLTLNASPYTKQMRSDEMDQTALDDRMAGSKAGERSRGSWVGAAEAKGSTGLRVALGRAVVRASIVLSADEKSGWSPLQLCPLAQPSPFLIYRVAALTLPGLIVSIGSPLTEAALRVMEKAPYPPYLRATP